MYLQVNLYINAQFLRWKGCVALPHCSYSLKTMILGTTYHQVKQKCGIMKKLQNLRDFSIKSGVSLFIYDKNVQVSEGS